MLILMNRFENFKSKRIYSFFIENSKTKKYGCLVWLIPIIFLFNII